MKKRYIATLGTLAIAVVFGGFSGLHQASAHGGWNGHGMERERARVNWAIFRPHETENDAIEHHSMPPFMYRFLPGRITSIGESTLKIQHGNTVYTIAVTSDTVFTDIHGNSIARSDMRVDDKILVWSKVSGTDVTDALKVRDIAIPR